MVFIFLRDSTCVMRRAERGRVRGYNFVWLYRATVLEYAKEVGRGWQVANHSMELFR
jgi:hypothetical protein